MIRVPRSGMRAVAAAAVFAILPVTGRAALSSTERDTIGAYLGALAQARYDAAFALLDPSERAYFGSVRNYASVYAADAFALRGFRLVSSDAVGGATIVVVSERIAFRDHARQAMGFAEAKVPYALVRGREGLRVRDAGHPWRAVAPAAFVADAFGVHAAVRKISFFAGRVELVINVQNRSASAVTLLPYDRTVLRDGNGTAYRPIVTRAPSLTDRAFYLGLRLPRSAEYTGFLTFATPARFEPASLSLSVAPALADGASAPFALDFSPCAIAL